MFWKSIAMALIPTLVPAVLDVIISVLRKLAADTETDVDDAFVETLARYKDKICGMIIKGL